MCGVFGLVPVGVERELDPEPPDRGEQHDEAGQGTQGRVILERTGELADGADEGQVEEELDPAGAPFLTVVAVRGPQLRTAEVHHVTVAEVASGRAGRSWM